MSRKNKKKFKAQSTTPSNIDTFTFGEPVSVLDKREIFDYFECVQIDHWYEPPISFDGLSKLFRAAPHHSSAIYVKRNILVSTFQPSRFLSKLDFSRFALDFLTFGNAYLERRNNMMGNLLKLTPPHWLNIPVVALLMIAIGLCAMAMIHSRMSLNPVVYSSSMNLI